MESQCLSVGQADVAVSIRSVMRYRQVQLKSIFQRLLSLLLHFVGKGGLLNCSKDLGRWSRSVHVTGFGDGSSELSTRCTYNDFLAGRGIGSSREVSRRTPFYFYR